MPYKEQDLLAGAHNLAINCASISAGIRLLVITEPPGEDYYDPALAPLMADVCRGLGAEVEVLELPFEAEAREPEPWLAERMRQSERVLFLARLGDQLRFQPGMADSFAIMCYALDRGMLASDFGRVSYGATLALKNFFNRALRGAGEIHVTCPLGTDFRGPGPGLREEAEDTTVRRFPLSVFAPIPPAGFAGRLVQAGFLCGTGSQFYSPPACEIKELLTIHFEGHRITRFSGSAADVAAAEAHYDHVAGLFDLERNHIHSWHAGIHPGCNYEQPANSFFDRWSNGAFGNPRVLHFHTCGTHAPGEISLNIIDPTVRIDGIAAWEAGRLHPERLPGGEALLAAHPDLAACLARPSDAIGLGPNGRLQY